MPAEKIATPPPGSTALPETTATSEAHGLKEHGALMDDSSLVVEAQNQADPNATPRSKSKGAVIDPPRVSVNLLELRAASFSMQFSNALTQLDNAKVIQDSMTDINRREADKQLQKINEQVEKQKRSDQKSGFLGFLNKLFNIVSVVVGVALIATGVGAGFGVGLLVGVAVGKILEIDAVKNLIVKAASAIFGDTVGQIVAQVVIIAVQIAIAIKSGNIGAALGDKPAVVMKAIQNVLQDVLPLIRNAETVAAGLKTANAVAQAAGGVAKGATSIDMGITNYQLAGLKEDAANITAFMVSLQGMMDQIMASQKRQMSQISSDLKTAIENIQATDQIAKYRIS